MIIITLVCPLLVCLVYATGVLDRIEWQAYDYFVQSVRGDRAASKEVAVVLIDEASLQAMNPVVGRWPWPRSVYSELLEFLDHGEPAAVAFDILFTEDQKFDNCELASSGDRLLAQGTAHSGVVVHAQQIIRDDEDESNKSLLNADMPSDFRDRFAISGYWDDEPSDSNNFYLPLPELYGAANSVGVVEFSSDPDGVYRRTRLMRRYKDDFFPVLGLAPVLKKLGIEKVERTPRGISFGDIKVPLWPDGKYMINMYGKYDVYSISGILASQQKISRGEVENLMVDPSEFEGKIVFIGASAVGVEDLKHTSMSKNMAGVMLHASLASNILKRDFLTPPNAVITVLMIFLLSAATSLSVLLGKRTYMKVAIPVAALVLFYIMLRAGYAANVIYEAVPPVMGMGTSFVGAFIYLSLTEGREKRRVRRMLGQYVSPHMLASLVDNREGLLKAEVGTREYVSVLFSDIRSFTSISENEPPERIVHMLNRYFSDWSDAIFRHDGTIDKFVGDAVMALWGAPLITENHAEQAVRSALDMLAELPSLNKALMAEGYPEIKIGIGVHTGYAVLGNIGSERKLDYTVIGDTVNLSSRLEGLTKQYACDILISESTYLEVKDIFQCTYADTVKVKGKEAAVRIYKVEGGKGNV